MDDFDSYDIPPPATPANNSSSNLPDTSLPSNPPLGAPSDLPNPPATNSCPATSSSEDHQGSALNNAAVERRLFPETPAAPRSGNLSFGQMQNSLTTKKSSTDAMLSSAKKLENIQKQSFSPANSHNFASNSCLDNFEKEESEQPKILNLSNEEALKAEVMRSKRTFLAAGPPMLKDKLTLEEFYDWQNSMVQFLELLPGYQKGTMLNFYPNLEGMSEENLRFTVDKYELIYKTLNKAIANNKLVKLKTSATRRVPFCDIVTWWQTVAE
jgi:hypothetical protein